MNTTWGWTIGALAATVVAATVAVIPARSAPSAAITAFNLFSQARQIPAVSQWARFNGSVLQLLGPQSRLGYAKACAVDIGTIPEYHCNDGVIIPITVGGVAQSSPVAGDGCDNPVKLGLSNGQCVPFTRLLSLQTGHPDVTVMAICRRYHGRTKESTQYDDLAIVAHNSKTGTTCFFQSPVDRPTPIEGAIVPSPMADSAAVKAYWLEPLKDATGNVSYTAPAQDGNPIYCTSCHDSDPFILSPWMKQVAKLNLWDPNGGYLVDRTGTFSPVAGRPWVTGEIGPPQAFTEWQKCQGCHRIGGSTLHVIANGPGGLHADNGFPDFHGFMPLANTDSAGAWPYYYNEAVFELDNCVNPANGKPAKGCNAVRAGTIKVPAP